MRAQMKHIIAGILVFILLSLQCYVPEAFATNKTNIITVTEEDDKSFTQESNKDKGKQETITKNKSTEIIVKYKNEIKKDNTLSNVKKKTNIKIVEQKKFYKQQKISIYEIDSTDNLKETLEALNLDNNVEYAQPNYPLTVTTPTIDTMLSMQWGLVNSGQSIDGTIGRENVDINVNKAWEVTTGNEDVVVGILDTGIDLSHWDLKDNIYHNKNEIPNNGIDDDNNGYIDDISGWDFFNDDNSVFDSASTDTHGTYVAGIIAASSNNQGIIGVAPGVKVMPLKFINGDIGYTSDAIEAIEYAILMGIKIVNCSFGGSDNNPALKSAMENSDILFVCAAGNSGTDVANKAIYPAAFDLKNTISVASIDSTGELAKFTCYGQQVDVAAPGVNVYSTIPINIDSSISHKTSNGTSASAAFVSGIAALIHSEYPNESIKNVKNRIIEGVVPCSILEGKIGSAGRVDAFATLTGIKQEKDLYLGVGIDDSTTPPTDGGGEDDTWYTLDERATKLERLHYGKSGVYVPTGNFSFSCTDMTVISPASHIDITRTFNSRSSSGSLLGKGWTFGFEGSVVKKYDGEIEVNLPNGSTEVFNFKNGKYVGEGTRSTFDSYVLTTTDQTKYIFDNNTNKLVEIRNKYGNYISINYEFDKLVSIYYQSVLAYTITYNNFNNNIDTITDQAGRKVKYEYDYRNLLTCVTDPEGSKLKYVYNHDNYLTSLVDQRDNVFLQLQYGEPFTYSEKRVVKITDAAGATYNYEYGAGGQVTISEYYYDRHWLYTYDAAMRITFITDKVNNLKTIIRYGFGYGFGENDTYYPDITFIKDGNGNNTFYNIDYSTGNINAQINPDSSITQYKYDQWNNVIEEISPSGSKTYYIYDSNGAKLLKKIQPLDGVSEYNGDATNFAVTSYEYYTYSEASTLFGCSAYALLKSVQNPELETTTYTYDSFGNIISVTDSIGNVTTYEYNIIGQKILEKTHSEKTVWDYDKNGLVIREKHYEGDNVYTKRWVYDKAGNVLFEVEPLQYDASKDNLTTGVYTGTVGTRYGYYDSGYLKYVTNPLGRSRTEYTWDKYGNKISETFLNGPSYIYEYDKLNRQTKQYIKENYSTSSVLMTETINEFLWNGNTKTTVYTYTDSANKISNVTITDYLNRVVETQDGNNNRQITEYNTDGTIKLTIAFNGQVTYYEYDALGNKSAEWKQMSSVDGKTMYSWTGYTYDKASRLITKKQGISLVTYDNTITNNQIPSDVYTTQYSYVNGQLSVETDSEGRRTEYQYDKNGRVIKEIKDITSDSQKITENKYNYLGKVTEVSRQVRSGDIYGNNYNNNTLIVLKEYYKYDANGNMIEYIDADNNITRYTYDAINCLLTTSKEIKDDLGKSLGWSKTTLTYTWDGQIATETNANNHTTTYIYDAKGNRVKTIDALGNTAYQVYDNSGRVIAMVSPKNYIVGNALSNMDRTEFIYDANNRVFKKIEIYYNYSYGRVQEVKNVYEYDGMGNIIKNTDAMGNITWTEYNLAGLIEGIIEPESSNNHQLYTVKKTYNGLGQLIQEEYEGALYSYILDGHGNILKKYVNNQLISTSTYDYLDRLISETDGNGNTIRYKWNAFNKMSECIEPGDDTIPEYTTIYQYDRLGNLKYSKDSMGTAEYYGYDNLGRNTLKQTKNESGNISITYKYTYDLLGNIISEEDGNKNITTNKYDASNRLIKSTNALNQSTTYEYDKNGNLFAITNYLNNTSYSAYDSINRLVSVGDTFEHHIERLEYNAADKQIASTDYFGNKIKFLYDKNLRHVGTTDNNGIGTFTYYDSRGNVIRKVDGNNNTTYYTYDRENRLIKVMDSLGYTTRYSYDFNGNMITQTDGNMNTTTYRYNARNLLIRRTDTSGYNTTSKSIQYTYYANGLLASMTDRNGIVTNYKYDVFGRLIEENAGGQKHTYTYDGNNNLLTMNDSSGVTTMTYDALNRNTSKTVPSIGKTIYTYDLANSSVGCYSIRTVDPMGNITLKTYDRLDFLWQVKIGDNNPTTYGYYPNGNKHSVIYPDGLTQSYSYDTKNQIVSLVNTKSDKTTISSYTYTYDNAGNQLTKVDSKGKTTYTYDALNRLSTVKEPSGKLTAYQYDGAGNRSVEKVTSSGITVTTDYTYNQLNRLIQTKSSIGELTKYSYDNNGNMLSKTSSSIKLIPTSGTNTPVFTAEVRKDSAVGSGNGKITLFTYDNYNQLTKMKNETSTSTYGYNADGYRVSKTVNGKTSRYLYENDKIVLETDSNNKQLAYQVYGAYLIYRSTLNETGVGSEAYYYLYNAQGDVTALIDTKGTIAATYEYDAFGNIISETGSANNPIRYAGYQYDKETGLYYLNARYYDSSIARFINEDTYLGEANDPLSLNLYTYCVNNPITYYDPSGHKIDIRHTHSDTEFYDQVLTHLQMLTDHTLALNDKHEVVIVKYADKITMENGNRLIERVIESDFTVGIQAGDSFEFYTDWRLASKGTGADGTIWVDFKSAAKSYPYFIDPKTGYVTLESEMIKYIALGHELVHADRAMRGVTYHPREKVTYKYLIGEQEKYFIFKSWTWISEIYGKEKHIKEEYATVGLKYNKEGDITENDLRAEHGLPIRGRYDENLKKLKK